MFKKILFLILLVPVAHSEILELTCEVPMPVHIVYDFETNEGFLNFPQNNEIFLGSKFGGKIEISKFEKIGDYYEFTIKKLKHTMSINRFTLKAMFYITRPTRYFTDGQCEKGLKTYDKYLI